MPFECYRVVARWLREPHKISISSVYTWYIPGIYSLSEYTWYTRGIYRLYTSLGFQMIVSTHFSLKRDSAEGKMCLFCHMTSVGWLEIMIQHTPSIIYDLHFPVDFRLNILFPHIFWSLHQNWVGIGGFTLTKLRHVGDEEETIPSCLDTRSPMMAQPVLLQSAFCALKKQIGRG